MNRRSLWILSLFTGLLFVVSAFRPLDATDAVKSIDYYGDAANSGKLLNIVKTELAAKRTPVLFFTATWCGPCKKFKSSLSDPLMETALKGVTFIMIDTDIDAKKEKFTAKYGVAAFPTFIKVDAEGNKLKKIDGGAWDEDVPANMAPAMTGFLN